MSLLSVNKNDFKKIIREEAKTPYIFVDFSAPWCGPCKAIEPVLKKIAADNDHITFLKVNIDEEERLAEHFEIESVPTFMIFRKGSTSPKGKATGASMTKIKGLLEAI